VFPFSPRPGTPAARMPQLDRAVIKERAARLRAKGEAVLQRHLSAQVGKTLRVLTEFSPIGHTEQFTLVRFGVAPAPGRIIDVRVAGHDGRSLIAA
jgi:threonylcarbamoyladenosine tRNA methylthiotransferase MtaB